MTGLPSTRRPDPAGRTGHPGADRAARWWAVLAWTLWALMLVGLLVGAWQDALLRRAGRPDLTSRQSAVVAYLLAVVSAGTVGAVVASRRPRHPVGWLLLGLELSVIALGLADGYASRGVGGDRGAAHHRAAGPSV